MRSRKDPIPISGAIERVTEGLAPATPLASVQSVWRTAVGDRIANSCQPTQERDGVVTVVCESAAWVQQLTLMQSDLMLRLEDALPDGAEGPGELRFTSRDPQS